MIKKNWVYLLFGLALLLYIVTRLVNQKNTHRGMARVTYKTIHSDSLGWGYDIYKGTRLFIHQGFIPGAEGKKGFVSEEQAATIAKLAIAKMKYTSFPAITTKELDSCGIIK